jgi:hypothetical protein
LARPLNRKAGRRCAFANHRPDASERSGAARVVLQVGSETQMKTLIGCAAIVLALASVTSAEAKGCLRGAAIGGAAGHFAGHHGLLGAAAGCVIGRHRANERARETNGQNQNGPMGQDAGYRR